MREAISAKSAASRPAPALDQNTASTPAATEHRYNKINHDPEKFEALFVDFYLDAYRKKPPKLIVLDPDGTDDPIHGNQEGSFFHGYYNALRHTEFENASVGTIRLKLLKIGALVTVSVRRVKVAIASAFPRKDVFALAHCRLRNMAA